MKKQKIITIAQSFFLVLTLCFACNATLFAVETPQPICVPRIPSSVTMSLDGSETGDWDSFSPLTIGYAADPSGDLSTRLAADSTYLYFLTEVSTAFSSPQVQTFFIGIDAAGGAKMLQIQPFLASDTAPMAANNLVQPPVTQLGGSSWTAWADPTPPNADFSRVLESSPVEKWILEGRINLAHIGITGVTTIDNFNMFLYINASFGVTTIQRYWPDQGGGFVDLATPASLTFGLNRCPDIEFSEPYVNFGKVLIDSSHDRSISISNSGEVGSQLQIQSASLNPAVPHFSLLSITKDGDGSSPPFSLGVGENATAFVRYQPTSSSSISTPHETSIVVTSNDPDESSATPNVAGNGREYVDTVFILDQSGSMLNQDKWVTTEWATEISSEVLRLFSFPQDRVGAVGFGGTSGNPDSFQLRPLATFPIGPTSITSGFADADSTYYTPVGLGIEEAHNEFSTDTRNHVGILMSDGKHNRPVGTSGATTVAGLNLPFAVQSNTKLMRIHTVALGTDSGVSTDLLNAIRTDFNPSGVTLTPATTYNITNDGGQLAEFFIEPLMEQLVVNRIGFDATPAIDGYIVERNAHKVLAIVAWQRGSIPGDIQVEVYDETGSNLLDTYDNSTSGYYKGPDANRPYTYILIDDVDELSENRVWKIKDGAGNPIAPPIGYPFILVDLNIKAVFSVDQEIRGTGNDIILKAKLTEVGTPLTNTVEHPVEVEALIGKPEEGFGTYVSTHDLGDCDAHVPTLPPFDPQGSVNPTSGTFMAITNTVVTASDTAASRGGVDVPSPRFQKIDALFRQCNKGDLHRTQLPGMKLYDDGTHDDDVANDGIYTLRFTNTEYEGSYVIHFRVNGTTPTGAKFSRIRTISEHLRVDVDPTSTEFDSRILSQVENIITREYYVIPRDKFGGYMGPGYHGQVKFTTTGGQWASPIRDYNNGIYSRILSYDITRGEPDVTPVIQGKPIMPIKPIKPTIWCWIYLIIIIILLLIIGWLIWLAVRRRSP